MYSLTLLTCHVHIPVVWIGKIINAAVFGGTGSAVCVCAARAGQAS